MAPRIGEAYRDRCVDRLKTHFIAGRLDKWELEDRVGKALVARTQGELNELVADCQRATGPSSTTPVKRIGACVAALAAIVALAAATSVGASSGSAELSTCVATGVAVLDDVDCPVLTHQQERLMQDADRASAAADQVFSMENGTDDARLRVLVTKAQAAAERAQEAVSEAQLVVAVAPNGRVGKNSLNAAARKARSAATDAARGRQAGPARRPVAARVHPQRRARRFYKTAGFVLTDRSDGHGNEEQEPDCTHTWAPSITC